MTTSTANLKSSNNMGGNSDNENMKSSLYAPQENGTPHFFSTNLKGFQISILATVFLLVGESC